MATNATEFKLTGRWAVDPQHECDEKLETGAKCFIEKEANCFVDEKVKKTVAKQEVSNEKIHRVLGCMMCGAVGDLTSCCPSTVRRILKSKRNCFGERGHKNRPRGWVLVSRKRRTIHCSLCGQVGHN